MNIKWHVLVNWVEHNLLKLICVDTKLNIADHFTKSLGATLFHRHNNYILEYLPPSYSPQCHKLVGIMLKVFTDKEILYTKLKTKMTKT